MILVKIIAKTISISPIFLNIITRKILSISYGKPLICAKL